MDLRASIQTWKKMLFSPGEETYSEQMQQPYATLATAVIWIFAAALVAVLIWIIIFLFLNPIEQSMDLTIELMSEMGFSEVELAEMTNQMEQTAGLSMVMILCGLFLGIPLTFFIWSGFLWLLARLFGGTGSFEKQTFLLSSFMAPIIMLTVILYLVPIIGLFVVLFLNIYTLYLSYFAIKVGHQLSPGKAATTIFVPALASVFFVCCGLTIWAGSLIAAMGTLS